MSDDESGESNFTNICQRLQWDDPELDFVCWCEEEQDTCYTAEPLDDAHCIRFGQSLMGNTNLKILSFYEFPFDESDCTAQGSKALANGLRQSKLPDIRMIRASLEFQQFMFKVIQEAHCIQHMFFSATEFDFRSLSKLLADKRCQVKKLSLEEYLHDADEDVDDMVKGLFRALSGNRSVTSLSLFDVPLSDEVVKSLVRIWKKDSCLQDIRVSNNYNGEQRLGPDGVQRLMKLAATHPALLKLDLSYNKGIGFLGIQKIGEELSSSGLEELSIAACTQDNSEAASMTSACQALADGLSKSSTIRSFKCNSNGINAAGLQLLMRAATNHQVLTSLHLGVRNPDELRTVGLELSHATLKELCVFYESETLRSGGDQSILWDEAFQALVDGLSTNTSLRTLRLPTWTLAPHEVQMLMTAIARHPSMEKLDLAGSLNIGYEGHAIIGQTLPNTRLTSISLQFRSRFPHVEPDSAERSVAACQALAQGLANSTTMQEFSLDPYGINPAGAPILVGAITNHPSMQKLTLHLNRSVRFEEIRWIAHFLPAIRLKELVITTSTPAVHSDSRSKAVRLARRILLERMKNNFYFCRLQIPDYVVDKEFAFYLELNRLGRLRLMGEQGLPQALWCDFLANLTGKSSFLFYFLREQPWLISSGNSGRKRRIVDV